MVLPATAPTVAAPPVWASCHERAVAQPGAPAAIGIDGAADEHATMEAIRSTEAPEPGCPCQRTVVRVPEAAGAVRRVKAAEGVSAAESVNAARARDVKTESVARSRNGNRAAHHNEEN
jgi:hypothetical protein